MWDGQDFLVRDVKEFIEIFNDLLKKDIVSGYSLVSIINDD